MRYTDRDCYAALIRVAASWNVCDGHKGQQIGVALPTKPKAWAKSIAEFAAQMGVPNRRWNTPECADGPRLELDHSPMGGVRPALCDAGETGQWTPQWWTADAGLGPGAKPRREFCEIVSAAQRAFEIASANLKEATP